MEQAQGPKPIIILLILIFCILLLSAIFAAIKVFSSSILLPQAQTCVVRGPLPDPVCSPGATFDVSAEQICVKGYSASVRNVSPALKLQVYEEYSILHHEPYEYEIDHIISLELGGSNEITNLYPESAEPRPGYHEKDKVENYLHRLVCNGTMTLTDAQHIIATNWTVMLENATS